VAPDAELLIPLIRRLLRPLVRLLILAGVSFPRLAEVLRQLYVDVASHDLLLDPKARTDSRISMLTGVHRKELRRLRTLSPAELEVPAGVALGAEIIGRWLGAAPWTDADGKPRPLPRSAAPGEPSFDGLVETVTKDVRPRTVLEAWLSQGLVTVRSDGWIALEDDAFLPKPGQSEQLFYFARNLHDHIAAAVANITAAGPAPYVDRSVHYDGLSPQASRQLQAFARSAAQRVLVQINREALRLVDQDSAEEGATERVNAGIFIFAEPEPAAGSPRR
jgi:hypothetical protein